MKYGQAPPQESVAFWECECATNYIHPRKQARCKVCKSDRASAGKADSIEVKAMQLSMAPNGDYKAVRHLVSTFMADEAEDLEWMLRSDKRGERYGQR